MTVEALASKGVGSTDGDGKKGHGIEAALEALSHAGGIGAILAGALD